MSDGQNLPPDATPPGSNSGSVSGGSPAGGTPPPAPIPPPAPMPPAAPAPAQPSASAVTAGLGIRFVAKLIDGVIVGLPLSLLFALTGLGTTWISGVVQALVFVGYLTYMESSTGASLGKKFLNLKVVDDTGNVPSQQTAFKRNAYGLIQIIPTFLGGLLSLAAAIGIAVTISTDEHNRGFHDKFAGTGVLRA